MWLQTIRGAVTLNGLKLSAGDGAALSEESAARIRAEENGEFILFDLAQIAITRVACCAQVTQQKKGLYQWIRSKLSTLVER